MRRSRARRVLAAGLLAVALAVLGRSASADAVKIFSVRADSANGAAHYTIPSATGPFTDLVGGHSGDLANFRGNAASGWLGDGTVAKPYRLFFSGEQQRVVVPAASIPDLQDSTQAVTAGVWFKTGMDGPKSTYDYILEWVQPPSPNPAFEGEGMSIAINQGNLIVYQNGWVSAGTVQPNTWYHVIVAKAAGDLRIYLNGQRTYTGTNPHMGAQKSPLTLGCSCFRYFEGFSGSAAFGDFFSGAIAQASVWKGAMDDVQALATFRADSALYLPTPADPPLAKLVEFRADSANGVTHAAIPGAASPWTDLVGTPTNGVLKNIAGADTTSGWAGFGRPASPFRLQMDGTNDVVAIPAGALSELSEQTPTTAEMWFRTGPDAASSTYHYLLEWLASIGSGSGMSMAVQNGYLQVYLHAPSWVNAAPVTANTWYHVVVVKDEGAARVYLNGALVMTDSHVNYGVPSTEVVLGASTWRGNGSYGDWHNAAIAQFALWRGALSAAQVLASFRADSAAYLGVNAPFAIAASAGAGGSIAPSGSVSVPVGGSQAFTIAADGCHTLADVQVDGASVGAVSAYGFTNVLANHTIAATFATNSVAIAASAGANGTIAPSGAVAVGCGGSQSFTLTPAACYQVADVQVDGASVGAVSAYGFTNVTTSHTIAATFGLIPYTIAASTGAGGTVSPSGAVSVGCGGSQAFTIAADGCHTLADVQVDGASVGAVASYSFTNVAANHTLAASFNLINYAIAASAGANGTIAPSGAVAVGCGGSQSFTLTPAACYQVADVQVDGASVGAVSGYGFTNVTASHTIAATFGLIPYTMAAAAGAGGTVSPSGAVSIGCGGSQAFTIAADGCHTLADVQVDGASVGAVASYSFANVAANHTLAATFTLNAYGIAASAGAGGTVSPSGVVSVGCGASQAFTIAGDGCHDVADVQVDGASVGAIASYGFTNVTAAHTLAATFVLRQYGIAASAGANGAITPSGATPVACGSSQSFTLTPAACYQVADVQVDGASVGAVSSYGFTNVTANHTISATFGLIPYGIVASAGAGGTVSPSGVVTVACGGSQSFTVAADGCHTLADLQVDGASVGAVASYAFTNVTAAHTLAATFTLNTVTITAGAGPEGTISPSGAVGAGCGSSPTFTIAPAGCHAVVDVQVDGASVGAVTSYTFANVTTAHTIFATFTLGDPVVYAATTDGGTITPAGTITVACGGAQSFALGADGCHDLTDVQVDGASVGAVTSYTFTNVTTAHTIAATFTLRSYGIAASAGANGSIAPSGAVAVGCGASQTFTLTPAACYDVADVQVDGASVGAVASYAFTNVTAAHTIAATFVQHGYTIAATAGANGTIAPSGGVAVGCGGSQSFTLTPAACYQVADVQVDGASVGAVSAYGFTNVTASHTIAATFGLIPYTIAASAGAGGTVSPSGAVSVGCGGSQAFTIAADGCHTLADVQVDGASVGAVASYGFTNVAANHTLAATFTLNAYGIAASAGAGGTVSPSGVVSVGCGASQAFTIAGDGCHDVADVLVDGASVGAIASYGFTNVTTAHTLAATFVLRQYVIAASGNAGGTVSPSGAVSVGCGGSQTFTIAADGCDDLAGVLVDGVAMGAVTSYTFTNVTASHTLAAAFTLRSYVIAASAAAHGTIAPSGAVTVGCGASQSFTIAGATGYHVADVQVDGASQGAVGAYTFTAVGAAHTIAATFAPNAQTLTLHVVGQGTVAASPTQATYPFGSTVQLAATAATAWSFSAWSGDASGTANPLTLTMDGDKSVTATFVISDFPPTAHLLSPNGGETLYTQETATILWSASDDHAVTAVDLDYTADQGATWTPIATGLANTGSYGWTVPVAPMTGLLMRVTAHDGLNQIARDTSDAAFATGVRPATLVLHFKADSATGTGPRPIPSGIGPWVDLVHGYLGAVANFSGTSTSGWNGDGTLESPHRLEYSGNQESVSLPPGSVPELQSPGSVSAAMWFRTPSSPVAGHYYYLLEWLESGGRGMSLAMLDGQLLVYLNPWASIANLAPGTWHHVVITKQTGAINAYVDGVLTFTDTHDNLGGQTSSLAIGCSTWRGPSSFGDFYKGAIGQVTVWHGALTSPQVVAEFNRDKNLYQPTNPAGVEGPAASLALAVPAPNPARGRLHIAFTLPDAAPARLELLDVGGRRLRSVDVTGFGPGTHELDLGRDGMPSPGLYWVRLTHAGRVLVRRFAVIR